MSNLLKSVYFSVNREDKVIIDSNNRLIPPPKQWTEQKMEGLPGFNFVPGMNVINISDVIEEVKEEEVIQSPEELLSEAQKQADAILERAKKQAESMKEDAFRQGKEQGYLEGKESGRNEYQQLEKCLVEKQQEVVDEFSRQISELEPIFAELTAKLVEKLTGIVVENHKETILYLMDQALRNAPKSKKYILQVSKEDIYFLESKKEELKSCIRGNAILELTENDSLDKNQCIIEMDSQMIDCSLDVQLQCLREELTLLSMD